MEEFARQHHVTLKVERCRRVRRIYAAGDSSDMNAVLVFVTGILQEATVAESKKAEADLIAKHKMNEVELYAHQVRIIFSINEVHWRHALTS